MMDAMEESLIFAGLTAQRHQERSQAVENVRAGVRKNGGRLRFRATDRLFSLLAATLQDQNWNVRRDTIALLGEIIPKCSVELQGYISDLLPLLVQNLGDTKVAIRKGTAAALKATLTNFGDLRPIVNAIISTGLENPETRVRLETLQFLGDPGVWEVPGQEEVFRLVEAVIGRLRDMQQEVMQQACKVLSAVPHVIGESAFDAHVSHLQSSLKQLYRSISKVQLDAQRTRLQLSSTDSKSQGRLTSSKSSASVSSGVGPGGGGLGVGTGYSSRHNTNMSLGPGGYDGLRSPGSSSSARTYGGSTTPAGSVAGGGGGGGSSNGNVDNLEFGLIPPAMLPSLRNKNNPDERARAVDELQNISIRLDNPARVLPHLGRLVDFLVELLKDANFKITISTLQILGHLVGKVGWPMRPYLEQLMRHLVDLLGDSKIVLRQANMKLINRLMQTLTPTPVLEILMGNLSNPNWRVREEIVNVVIFSLSSFPRQQFDFPKLSSGLLPALKDAKTRVKYVAVEAYAVIHNLVGDEQLRALLSRHRLDDATLKTLSTRFAANQLPQIGRDGLIEHSFPTGTPASQGSMHGTMQDPAQQAAGGRGERGFSRTSSRSYRSASSSRVASAKLPWGRERSSAASNTTTNPTETASGPPPQPPPASDDTASFMTPAAVAQHRRDLASRGSTMSDKSSKSTSSGYADIYKAKLEGRLPPRKKNTAALSTSPSRPGAVSSSGYGRGSENAYLDADPLDIQSRQAAAASSGPGGDTAGSSHHNAQAAAFERTAGPVFDDTRRGRGTPDSTPTPDDEDGSSGGSQSSSSGKGGKSGRGASKASSESAAGSKAAGTRGRRNRDAASTPTDDAHPFPMTARLARPGSLKRRGGSGPPAASSTPSSSTTPSPAPSPSKGAGGYARSSSPRKAASQEREAPSSPASTASSSSSATGKPAARAKKAAGAKEAGGDKLALPAGARSSGKTSSVSRSLDNELVRSSTASPPSTAGSRSRAGGDSRRSRSAEPNADNDNTAPATGSAAGGGKNRVRPAAPQGGSKARAASPSPFPATAKPGSSFNGGGSDGKGSGARSLALSPTPSQQSTAGRKTKDSNSKDKASDISPDELGASLTSLKNSTSFRRRASSQSNKPSATSSEQPDAAETTGEAAVPGTSSHRRFLPHPPSSPKVSPRGAKSPVGTRRPPNGNAAAADATAPPTTAATAATTSNSSSNNKEEASEHDNDNPFASRAKTPKNRPGSQHGRKTPAAAGSRDAVEEAMLTGRPVKVKRRNSMTGDDSLGTSQRLRHLDSAEEASEAASGPSAAPAAAASERPPRAPRPPPLQEIGGRGVSARSSQREGSPTTIELHERSREPSPVPEQPVDDRFPLSPKLLEESTAQQRRRSLVLAKTNSRPGPLVAPAASQPPPAATSEPVATPKQAALPAGFGGSGNAGMPALTQAEAEFIAMAKAQSAGTPFQRSHQESAPTHFDFSDEAVAVPRDERPLPGRKARGGDSEDHTQPAAVLSSTTRQRMTMKRAERQPKAASTPSHTHGNGNGYDHNSSSSNGSGSKNHNSPLLSPSPPESEPQDASDYMNTPASNNGYDSYDQPMSPSPFSPSPGYSKSDALSPAPNGNYSFDFDDSAMSPSPDRRMLSPGGPSPGRTARAPNTSARGPTQSRSRTSRPPKAPTSASRRSAVKSSSALRQSTRGPGGRSGGNAGDAFMIPFHELEPHPAPEGALRAAYKSLEKGNNQEQWTEKCEGLTIVRRLAAHHPQIVLDDLHAVLLAVMEEVRNLRSSVSRLAILCMGDLYSALGRAMDQDLDQTVTALLQKISAEQGSSFIREDVDAALAQMVEHVAQSRAVGALVVNGGHKSALVRRTVARFLSDLAESMGARIFGIRDAEKMLQTTANLVQDGSPETRYFGRRIVDTLSAFEEFDRMCSKCLKGNSLKRVKDCVDTLQRKGLGEMPIDPKFARSASESPSQAASLRRPVRRGGAGRSSARSGRPGSKLVAAALMDDSGQEMLPSIMKQMASSDWRERDAGVEQLQELAETRPQDFKPHASKTLFSFLPRLGDSNSKVNLRAIQALSHIIPLVHDALDAPVVVELVPALAANLASKNTAIREAAEETFSIMAQVMDPTLLVSPFAKAIEFGNSRIKEAMTEVILFLVPAAHARSPKLITKHLYPLLLHLVDEKKSGIRTACTRLCQQLYDLMGTTFTSASALAAKRSDIEAMLV